MAAPAASAGTLPKEARYSALAAGERRDAEAASRALTDEIYDGLDLRAEIRTVAARNFGDTLLLWEGSSRLSGFAVCHWGPASEAGADCLFIKFGAVRPGQGASDRFGALLDAAAALARDVGMVRAGRGQHRARTGLSPDDGARLSRPHACDCDAPAERVWLQPFRGFRARRLALTEPRANCTR
jgi:hypothetical protein